MGTRRVGHAGTLDPFATGLLVILVGRATRLSQYVVGLPKRYTGTIRLGTSTATDDPTGEVLESNDSWNSVTDASIRDAMHSLMGRQRQRPPRYSAKKVGGQAAYRLARRGERVELAEQWVEVHELTLIDRDGRDVRFDTYVGSGVYVRSLARDLGSALGCGAHLSALRRLTVGSFSVESALSPAHLDQTPPLLPALEAVRHLALLEIDEATRERVRFGEAIRVPGDDPGPVALTADRELVAVAERDGEVLRPRVVLEG